MGLEEAATDLLEEGGGGSNNISCSICLEDVTDFGDRAWAKLQCSHHFHLDCIGSAFNVKGAMQCPNCRKVEKGQWLYADGHPDLNIDDLVNDDQLYELSFSEASMWCPYSGFTQLAAAFEEVDFPATGYHDLVGQHAVFNELGTVSSATRICPYFAYFQPIHPSTSSNTSANVPEGPSRYNNQWNSQSATREIPNSYGFPTMDFHYQTHADHPSVPSTMPRRPARTNADMSRGSYVHHPFVVGQSSTRAPGSNSSYMTHPGSAARAQERSQAFQAYFQQPTNSPAMRRVPLPTGPHRSNGQVQISQYGTSSDQTHGWSSSYNLSASSVSTEHNIWERDPNRPFHQSGGGSFRHRNGSDRTQSQSQQWL